MIDPLLPAWFVVFVAGRGHWWQKLLKPGFGHVYAFGWDAPAERWLLYSWGLDGVVIRAMPADWFPAFLDGLRRDRARVLFVPTGSAIDCSPRLFATCVTAVETLLRLSRSRRALTPYALYRNLLALGASSVMEA